MAYCFAHLFSFHYLGKAMLCDCKPSWVTLLHVVDFIIISGMSSLIALLAVLSLLDGILLNMVLHFSHSHYGIISMSLTLSSQSF